MRSHPIWLGVLFAVGAAGCAVNDWGLVRVRRYENPSARVVELDSWGLHLLTTPGERSLTLGHSSRSFVFPREGDQACAAVSDLVDGTATAATERVDCDGCPGLSDLGAPISIVAGTTGISFAAGPNRFGISLGVRSRAAIEIPSDSEVQLWLRHHGDHPPEAQICIRKEPPR